MSNRHKKKSCAWCGKKFTTREETIVHQNFKHILKDPDGNGELFFSSRRNPQRQVFKCTEA